MFLTEYNTRSCAVIFQNNGSVIVKNFEDNSNHEIKIFCVKHLEIFVGQS